MNDLRPGIFASMVLYGLIATGPLSLHGQTVAPQAGGKPKLSSKLKAEGTASLAIAARQRGSAVRGAILFPQQVAGCANCHAPGGRDLLGPDLGELGPEATDVYLAESILYPSKVVKKGFEAVTVVTEAGQTYAARIINDTDETITLRLASPDRRLITVPKNEIDTITPSTISTMPAGLVDQLADRQQFLDLLRYMMELKSAGPGHRAGRSTMPAGGGELATELRGLVLLDEFKCAACHGDLAVSRMVVTKQAPNLAWSNGRINPNYIERFIAAPLEVKPGTAMPDVMHALADDVRRRVAREITHYIVSLGTATFQLQRLDPIAAQRGGELFHSVGCVACHWPRDEQAGVRLRATSESLQGVKQKYNLNGLVEFLEDPHAVRPSGRMPNMRLSHWEAIDLANYLLNGAKGELLSKAASEPEHVAEFALDRELASQGKLQFQRLGCNQCHVTDRDELPARPAVPTLARARADQGCLGDTRGAWPRYDLNVSQRDAIRAALEREPTNLTSRQQIDLTLATFNCVACHQRDTLGGVAPDRDPYFHTTNPNLGPQGRIPPHLTNVGAKLNPKWLRQVLVSGRTIRPYMMTRMPQYGTNNVAHLVDLFEEVDRLPVATFAEFKDLKLTRNAGSELVGNGGLNCIACHTFQQKPSATMSAVDLTEMAERLRKNWFYQYMRDPQWLSANTVMPSFWPGGRAIRKDILEGDTGQQIEAIWQYLLDGRQARTPKGLVRKPIELVATDEAVMLRRSYQGIGKRGIGVGYPKQVNLAFDAEQMRVAMIWKGKFADPGGVWMSQGHGTVRPLGSDLIRFAVGPELDDADKPWSVEDGRSPLHQFKGYDLDRLRRPTLKYRFDTIDVEDYPIDIQDGAEAARIRRTLRFTSQVERPNTVFRVATDQSIEPAGPGTFRVGESLRIRVDDAHRGYVVTTASGQQLRIPLNVSAGTSTLVIEYIW